MKKARRPGQINGREVRLLCRIWRDNCVRSSRTRGVSLLAERGVGQTAGAMSQEELSKGNANWRNGCWRAFRNPEAEHPCINCTQKPTCAALARAALLRTKSVMQKSLFLAICTDAYTEILGFCRSELVREGNVRGDLNPTNVRPYSQTNLFLLDAPCHAWPAPCMSLPDTLAGSLATRPFSAGVEGPSHDWS